jgi:hypothetical protein
MDSSGSLEPSNEPSDCIKREVKIYKKDCDLLTPFVGRPCVPSSLILLHGDYVYRLGPSEEGDRIQSPKRCVLNKNRTRDNVQKNNICIDHSNDTDGRV